MNFRLIALASCVALGSIAFGGKAQAQEFFVPTDFVLSAAGNFGPSCTITTSASAGVLKQSGTTVLTSNPLTVGTASPASFGLTCTGAAGFNVKPTTSAAGSTALAGGVTLSATLRDGTTVIATSSLIAASGNSAVTALGTAEKTFNLIHVATGALTPGPYAFDTVVTITPQ